MKHSVNLVRFATAAYRRTAEKKYPGLTRKGLAGLIRLKRNTLSRVNRKHARGIRAIRLSHVAYPER